MKRLLLLAFLLICADLNAQTSPYYFLDTLLDDGLVSPHHLRLRGKIHWNVSPEYNNRTYTKDSLVEINASSDIKGLCFLNRSLRYYYTKYASDSTQKASDWDYKFFNKELLESAKSTNQYLPNLIYIVTCGRDTIAAWKVPISIEYYRKKTWFEMSVWEESYKLYLEGSYSPLMSYIKEQKKSGNFNIRVDLYAGKINSSSFRDRGPEILASGKFNFIVDPEKIKELKEMKDKSYKQKFMSVSFWRNVLK